MLWQRRKKRGFFLIFSALFGRTVRASSSCEATIGHSAVAKLQAWSPTPRASTGSDTDPHSVSDVRFRIRPVEQSGLPLGVPLKGKEQASIAVLVHNLARSANQPLSYGQAKMNSGLLKDDPCATPIPS